MNKKQLTDLVIIPTLKEIPHGYSEEAVMSAQMIIAHESKGGHYIAQKKGPALGIIQMEPDTYYDVWKNGDSIWKNAILLGIVRNDTGVKNIPDINRLKYDLRFNIFMLRQKLFMATGALPSTAWGMASYLKTHWNGEGENGGKATPQKYHDDFMKWVY